MVGAAEDWAGKRERHVEPDCRAEQPSSGRGQCGMYGGIGQYRREDGLSERGVALAMGVDQPGSQLSVSIRQPPRRQPLDKRIVQPSLQAPYKVMQTQRIGQVVEFRAD